MPKKPSVLSNYLQPIGNSFRQPNDNPYSQTSGLSPLGEQQAATPIGAVAQATKKRAALRTEASNAIRGKGKFQGNDAWKDDPAMKQYVNGLALENDGRIFEGDENPIDNINPVNWIYQAGAGLAKSRYESEQSNSMIPYLRAVGNPLLQGAMGFDPLGSAMKQAAKVPGMVSQAYKINPWAFKANPNNSYRVIGDEAGLNDITNSGVVRANPNGTGTGMLSRPSDVAYYERGKIGNYPGKYMVETERPTYYRGENNPVLGNQIKSRHYGAAPYNEQGARYDLPIEDVNIYKKDWLQGYKKVDMKEDGGKIEPMKKKKFGGKPPMAAYGMSMQNNYGFSPNMMQGFDRSWNQQTEMQPLNSAPMHQMDLPTTPAPTAADIPEENSMVNHGSMKPWGFKTPGTGDLITGALGIANTLMPGYEGNQRREHQYGNYNPNAWGTGSKSLYEEGGMVNRPKYNTVRRNEGGIKITEEVPMNMGMAPQPVAQPYTQPFPIPANKKSLTYEHLKQGNQDIYSPVFNGDWSNRERQDSFRNGLVPRSYNGNEVVSPSAYNDMWNSNNTPMNGAHVRGYNPGIDITTNMGFNAKRSYNPYQFREGGSFQAGQQVELSEQEIEMYKKMGYTFK